MNPKKETSKSPASVSPTWPLWLLYAIVMIEGGAVMGIELLGVKMMAPFYGTTLYVWAGVLTVTLAGLASGYFAGGRIASSFKGNLSAPVILFTGAVLVFLMPYTSLWIMESTNHLGIRMGSLVAALIFLMPPLICMGMISPIIIQLATSSLENTGKIAGMVYALSTLAGIIMTLVTGLYLLPEWGIKSTVLLIASLLGAISCISFLIFKKYVPLTGAAIVLVLLFVSQNRAKIFRSDIVWLKDRSEGILGQITVFDYLDSDKHTMRYMLINGIPQTYVMPQQNPISSWPYIHRLATMTSGKPKGARALLIGMAGGTLCMELKSMGFQTDIVEIDPRMPKLAEKYFGFNPEGFDIYIDDGRHYINTTEQQYDIVIIDVVNGEVQPYHMFTRQAFENLKKRCTKDAMVVVNFQGYLEGPKSLPIKSLMKTLTHVGFKLKMGYNMGSEDTDGDANGDVHLIAYLGEQDFEHNHFDRLNPCCKLLAYDVSEIFMEVPISYADGMVLEDDLPEFEKLNLAATELWRKKKQKDFMEFSKYGFTLYN